MPVGNIWARVQASGSVPHWVLKTQEPKEMAKCTIPNTVLRRACESAFMRAKSSGCWTHTIEKLGSRKYNCSCTYREYTLYNVHAFTVAGSSDCYISIAGAWYGRKLSTSRDLEYLHSMYVELQPKQSDRVCVSIRQGRLTLLQHVSRGGLGPSFVELQPLASIASGQLTIG